MGRAITADERSGKRREERSERRFTIDSLIHGGFAASIGRSYGVRIPDAMD